MSNGASFQLAYLPIIELANLLLCLEYFLSLNSQRKGGPMATMVPQAHAPSDTSSEESIPDTPTTRMRRATITVTRSGRVEPEAPPAQRLSIRRSFEGQTVFLTGASGYVGSLVLEQLLRTCPGLKKVR